MDVCVYEGDRKFVENNLFLGTFCVEGVPARLKGQTAIEIQFDVDDDGLLTVTAWDVSNKDNKQSITITNTSNELNQKQILSFEKELEKYVKQDEETHEKWIHQETLRKLILKFSNSNKSEPKIDAIIRWAKLNTKTASTKELIDHINKLKSILNENDDNTVTTNNPKKRKITLDDDDDQQPPKKKRKLNSSNSNDDSNSTNNSNSSNNKNQKNK